MTNHFETQHQIESWVNLSWKEDSLKKADLEESHALRREGTLKQLARAHFENPKEDIRYYRGGHGS